MNDLIFYTVSFEPDVAKSAGWIFKPGTTPTGLQAYAVPGNPPWVTRRTGL